MSAARTPFQVLAPGLVLSLAAFTTLCPAGARAGEYLAGRGSALQSKSTPLLSKRQLAYAAIGGTASWFAFEHENATVAPSAINVYFVDTI